MSESNEPISDFLARLSRSARPLERRAIDEGSKAYSKAKSAAAEATSRARQYQADKTFDEKLRELDRKLSEGVNSFLSGAQDAGEGQYKAKDDTGAAGLYHGDYEPDEETKRRIFGDLDESTRSPLSNRISSWMSDAENKVSEDDDSVPSYTWKTTAETIASNVSAGASNILKTLQDVSSDIRQTGEDTKDPEIKENDVYRILNEPVAPSDSPERALDELMRFDDTPSAIIIRGKSAKGYLDSIANFAAKRDMSVLKVSTSTKVLSAGDTPLDRARHDVNAFLYNLDYIAPTCTLVAVDARSGLNGFGCEIEDLIFASRDKPVVVAIATNYVVPVDDDAILHVEAN